MAINGYTDTKIASTFEHNFLCDINIFSFSLINRYFIISPEKPKIEVYTLKKYSTDFDKIQLRIYFQENGNDR